METTLSPLGPLETLIKMLRIHEVMKRLVEAATDVVCDGCLSLYFS
jgi:hypothetical protein